MSIKCWVRDRQGLFQMMVPLSHRPLKGEMIRVQNGETRRFMKVEQVVHYAYGDTDDNTLEVWVKVEEQRSDERGE